MIDGMSEICIDCIHQEVCRYECHSPSEHCNDYAVADDFRPQGKWNYIGNTVINHSIKICECNQCMKRTYGEHNFCPNCGADMRGDNNG